MSEYLDAWEGAIGRGSLDDELRHVHQCPGTLNDPHEFECRVMICRDQKVTRCWEHRQREPSERPRSS